MMISGSIAVRDVVSDLQRALYNEIQHLSNYFLFQNFEPSQTRGTRISGTTVCIIVVVVYQIC